MTGKTCIVTGASLGIGKETAAALAGMGARVVTVCRDPARGEAARADIVGQSGSSDVELMIADLSSLDEIRGLAAAYRQKHQQLHVLVNNAGAYNANRTTTKDGFETTFGVNHLAYFLLTGLLLDVLKASAPARIINVSSMAHLRGHMNFDDLQSAKKYSGMKAYGQSKLANVLFTYELARRLEGTGVTANALHPGVVRTGFGKNNPGWWGALFGVFQVVGRPFYISPAQGAATSIYLASSPEVEGVTGKYFVKCRAVDSNAESRDAAVARRLWQVSEEMTKPAMAPAR
jgi:NAD(P)-dependent dehydrogenase (short-subunit alcohol dehydrogenase family)